MWIINVFIILGKCGYRKVSAVMILNNDDDDKSILEKRNKEHATAWAHARVLLRLCEYFM